MGCGPSLLELATPGEQNKRQIPQKLCDPCIIGKVQDVMRGAATQGVQFVPRSSVLV